MKFSPLAWKEVGNAFTHKKGRLQLRLSREACLYAEAQGVEAIVGVAHTFDIEISEPCRFRIEGLTQAGKAYLWEGLGTTSEPADEIFTNIDRMTQESGTVLEIRKAMRQFEIQRREALAEIRRVSPRPQKSHTQTENEVEETNQEETIA